MRKMNNNSVEKSQNFKKSILNLIKYCKSYLPFIICALLLSIAGAVLTILGPNYLGDITNHIATNIFTGIDLNFVLNIGLILILFYSLSTIFNLAQGFIMASVSQKISKKLRKEITDKINKLELKYFDKTTCLACSENYYLIDTGCE